MQSRHLEETSKGSRIYFSGNRFTPPLSVTPRIFPTIGIRARRFRGPKLKIRMSYRREIPKLNRDNFAAWQELMRLHLATISDSGCTYLDVEYKTPSGTLSVGDC